MRFATWQLPRFDPRDEDWWCPRCGEFVADYGFYPGGDPRRFQPDPECNSPQAIADWGVACWRAWAFGEHVATSTGWITPTVHVCGGWMGTSWRDCDCWDWELCAGEVAA